MNILMLQTNIEWCEPLKNRVSVRQMIGEAVVAGGAPDLIVLPEMFTTGFCMSPSEAAEKANSETLKWMRGVSAETGAALAGSVSTEEDGRYYNRFYFVKPDGKYATYDKRHLFTYSGEDKKYTAGSERVIVEHGGFRILLQICYDLRFPVFARNRGDYDMIIYVASWPLSRVEAWKALLKARAIENVCYVVGVNRTGVDPVAEYNGSSALYDFKGNVIAAADTHTQAAFSGVTDIKALMNFRAKFPALDDADEFTINGL